MNAKPRGRQFFNNPGPTNIPDRVLRAMDRPVLDFMSDEFLAIQHACHAGVKRVLKTDQTLYMYNAERPRRLGSRARQPVLRRRHRADRRDRLLLAELGGDGGQSRHQGRDLRRRLAQGRRRHQARRAPGQGQGARDQGRAHRPQRDRDRHGPAGGRDPPRHGRGQAPCPAAVRHDLLARLAWTTRWMPGASTSRWAAARRA